MPDSDPKFFREVVDSIEDSLAVLDRQGDMVFVNQSWVDFCEANAGDCGSRSFRQNYLDVCDTAARNGDQDSKKVATGLRALLQGRITHFEYEYPCHSPNEKRWFLLNSWPLRGSEGRYFVLTHKNITKRKQMELAVARLSLTDGLTGVANRRHLDQFFHQEWLAHVRSAEPIAVLLLDIDYFKRFNDSFGHQAGDNCLRAIARELARFSQRPRDLCARYGGEEFALVLGNTELETAKGIATAILEAVRSLSIPHPQSDVAPVVTVSIGVAACVPLPHSESRKLLQRADAAMYQAKSLGRNQVQLAGSEPLSAPLVSH